MSQMSVATTVAKRSTQSSRRTSLRVVTPEERVGSAWFPALCVTLLLAGLGVVLGLNTAMAQDSFEVTALEAESARLADTEDSLTHSINDRLATEAGDLGMVPAGGAAFIDLDKSRVLGVATAAEKPDGFTVDAARTTAADESGSGSSSDTSADKESSSSSGEKARDEKKKTDKKKTEGSEPKRSRE